MEIACTSRVSEDVAKLKDDDPCGWEEIKVTVAGLKKNGVPTGGLILTQGFLIACSYQANRLLITEIMPRYELTFCPRHLPAVSDHRPSGSRPESTSTLVVSLFENTTK